MPRSAQDITDAELAVLQVLWRRNSATVRQIAEELYSGSSASQHATTQKLLERLQAKGCVRRNCKRWPYVFEATVDRDALIGRRVQQTVDRFCDGSIQPLLAYLAGRLSARERRTLRMLLDERDQRGTRETKEK